MAIRPILFTRTLLSEMARYPDNTIHRQQYQRVLKNLETGILSEIARPASGNHACCESAPGDFPRNSHCTDNRFPQTPRFPAAL